MHKKNNKVKNLIIVFSSIFCCLILSSVFINRNFNLPDFFLRDIFFKVDKFVSSPFSSIGKDYDKLVNENISLKEELEKIKIDKFDNDELNDEIKRLKDTLKLNKLLSDRDYVNASVISRGFDYWNDRIIIDKGSNDGIENNMAVVASGGLIGLTDDVSSSSSSVILLSNGKFPVNISVKVKVENDEFFGILNEYSDGFYEIMGIVDNVNIPKNSLVVTTGYGNIFPSGIVVGYVDSIVTDNFDLSKIVKVKPLIDFNDISYVTIVKRDDK